MSLNYLVSKIIVSTTLITVNIEKSGVSGLNLINLQLSFSFMYSSLSFSYSTSLS